MKKADYYWMFTNLMTIAVSIVELILWLFDAPRDVTNICMLYTLLLCGWYFPSIALWILNRRCR